jgi:hypothetical protein
LPSIAANMLPVPDHRGRRDPGAQDPEAGHGGEA